MNLILSSLFMLMLGTQALANDCLETRGAFDIGSQETKLKIAIVDTCENKIDRVLVEDRRPIDFLGNLHSNSANEFTGQFIASAASEINEMKALGEKFQVKRWAAVVTSAFRKSSNADKASQILREFTLMPIIIIDDKLEAEIGFYGALTITDTPKEKVVVMDLGGGSAQISYFDKTEQKVKSYTNNFSSKHAKDTLYKLIQKKDTSIDQDKWDPNPVSGEQAWAMYRHYSSLLSREFNDSKYLDFSSVKLHYSLLQSGAKLIGIGGVIAKGVGRTLTGKTSGTLTLESMNEGLVDLIDKSSEELGGGPYVQTDVSNVLLVMAYFKVFLNSLYTPVQFGNVSLTEGLLIYPDLIN